MILHRSDFLRRFSEEDLKLLSRIPLLSALLDGNEEERARLEMCCDKSKLSDLTLLQWISTKEPDQSLENVVEISKAALIKVIYFIFSKFKHVFFAPMRNCVPISIFQYDEHALVSLKEDIRNLFHPDRLRILRNNTEISEKLMTLSGLIVTIKGAYEDQAKKASVSIILA